MIEEFELPAGLENELYDKILSDMLNNVTTKYDKIEGGFVYDMIAPAALEAAELLQMWLPLGIKTNFHMWAEDEWLDRHAHDCGLERRAATPSYGDLQVTTVKRVTFPEGFIFSVPGEDGTAAIDFENVSEVTINGVGTCRIRAVELGLGGNVAADTITIMKNPKKGVANITNLSALTGGTEAESDENLRKRIDDFYAGRDSSFVGNVSDYRRWAKSVAGVGAAHIIPTPDNRANTVKIVLADMNGEPANAEICGAVTRYIFGVGHDDLKRLAPIGVADYWVEPFKMRRVKVSMIATLSEGESVVRTRITEALTEYFKSLADEDLNYGTLYYVRVSALLTEIEGLEDFRRLRIDDELGNVEFGIDEIPAVGEVILS